MSPPVSSAPASPRYAFAAPSRQTIADVVATAVLAGLLTGTVEGVGMLLVQELTPRTRYVSVDVLWAAPLVSVCLFALVGGFAALLSRAHVRLATPWLTFFPLAMLASFNLLEVTSVRIHVGLAAATILGAGLAAAATRWYAAHETVVARFCRRRLVGALLTVPVLFLLIRGVDAARVMRAEAAVAAAGAPGPNVLVLVLDALRADHMSAYGYERETTPHLDRLAAEGRLYETAFSPSPWSLPAHASLLSGRLPSRAGIGWSDPEALQRSSIPVLPEALRDRGYRTAAFSANSFWVTHERFGRGFVEFDDYFYSLADVLARVNFGRAVERMVLRRLGVEDIPARRHAPDMNAVLLHWLDRKPDRPFFALVNYFDIHDPYLPPEPYRSRYARSSPAGGILNWRVGRSDPPLDADQVRGEIDAYDGAINYLDDAIGSLRTALEERGVLNNTIIVVTSDHGESFGEHGWYLHGHSLYLEQLRVPLFIRWPGTVSAGRIRNPVSIAAVPALVVDLVGGPNPFPDHGLSLMRARASAPVFAETEKKPWAPEGSPSRAGALRATISGCWHLITQNSGSELYNWCVDSAEQHDLSADPGSRDVLRRLGQARAAVPPEG